MAIAVEIAGIVRTTMVGKNIAWTDSVNGQAQARFTLADDADGFVPADGQAVEIKQDGTVRFEGLITGRPRRLAGPAHSSQLTFYQVTVGSYELLLNKKTVTRTYTGVAFETIVADLVSTYLPSDGITESVTAGTSHSITFNGETVAEALDILCELEADGRTWRLGIGKVLTIEVITATAAPVVLDVATGTLGLDPRPSITPDRSAYANTVIITGGGPDFQITYTASDAAEITARIAAEGGDGIYEYTEERPELNSEGEVQAAAEGVLEKRKTLRERFVGTTRVAGFAAGQSVTVDIAAMDISSQVFFVESVRTVTNSAGTEFRHTINGITGDPDGGWQSYYRRERKKARTIPMQIEAAPGLVRVEAAAGVLVHDPFRDPVLFAQGTPSGAQDESVSAIGITPDGTAMYSLRGAAGNVTVLEKWAITNNQPATSTSGEFQWAELAATGFKTELLISPNGTRGAYIQVGSPGSLGIIDLINGVLLGSVSTAISNNVNPGEPVWSPDGNWIYWPDIATANVYVYDVSSPSAPTEDNVFGLATLTTASGLFISSDGNSLVVTGAGGVAGVNVTDPTAPSQSTTVVGTADYISLDEDNGILVGMVRANGSQVRVLTLNRTGATVTLNTEQLVTLATSVMVGSHVIHHDGAAMCFSHRISLSSPNLLDAHVFHTVSPAAVTFVETFDYTHGAAGNLGPVTTKRGLAALWVFGFGTNAQVTFGTLQLDQIDPYEVEKPLRTGYGGTGNVGPYQKGTILVGNGLGGPTELTKLAGPLDDEVLKGDESEPTGVKWARELMRSLVNGTFRETFTGLVTSDGATVTMTLQADPTGDLTMFFSDSTSVLDCTPALTIVLTAGSDISPTENYVYILQSTKALTLSTSDWPTAEHIKVGLFLVPSATFVAASGPYITQNWNDHLNEPSNQGHLPELSHRSRLMSVGAIYHSGIDGNGTAEYVTITTNVGTPDNVHFKSTAGVLLQMHEQAYAAKDTSAADTLLVANDSVAAFDDISDLADLLTDAAGGSMAGKYFNFVVAGVANKEGEFGPLLVNVPGGSYNKQSDAEQDVDGLDVFTIPGAFSRESSTAFLICRITLRHQVASGGTWTHISTLDLRGVNGAGRRWHPGHGRQLARGYIDGLTTEIDASDLEHDIQINPGICTDSLVSNDKIIEVTAAFTKRIDAAWAVGDTNGGMATGSVAADTEYNLIIIEKDSDGTVDMMFDVSATGANVPAGYTARRRIGSVFTDGSANIRPYSQSGDVFLYNTIVADLGDATGTPGTFETVTVSVPPSVVAILNLVGQAAGTPTFVGVRVRATGASGTPASVIFLWDSDTPTSQILGGLAMFRADSSSQFEYTLDTDGTWQQVDINTSGWIDARGRNA